ncbi:type IV pilus assembly protein PilM [Patescibacteria group bacterium]
MSLFKPDSYLGVDIGTASIKIVELAPDKSGPRLLTYGLIEFESGMGKDGVGQNDQVISEAIKQIARQAKVHSKSVVSSLPGFSVFSSLIEMPKMTHRELGEAIKYEAKRYVPISLENMVLDWKVVKQKEISTKEGLGTTKMEVLLTAAPKTLVNRYVKIFKESGFKLLGLETESFALARSLVGNDKEPVLVLDIGGSATDIFVIVGGFPILTRTIDTGGKAITASIAQRLRVSLDRAEQFKRDFGLKDGQQQIPEVIQEVMGKIVNEIQNVLKLYYGKHQGKIGKVMLSGGDSQMKWLAKYIEDEINIKTFVGNPWARISYPEALVSTLESVGSHFAVAVGLAMRELVKS